MKFIIDQEEFSKVLIICLRAIALRPNLPILSNILISTKNGNLNLFTTNLEIAISLSIPIKIESKGETTTPARVLDDYISSLPKGKIKLELDNDLLILESENTEARLTTASPAEFPSIPKGDDKNPIKLQAGQFISTFDQVAFASSTDEGRRALTGVLMESDGKKTQLVATDGYRLSYRRLTESSINQKFKIIIPAKSIQEILKIVSDSNTKNIQFLIADNNNQIIFKVENIELVSRLIDGDYPAWENIIPTDFKTTAVFDKEPFIQAVRQVSVFAKDAGNVVRLKLANNKLTFSAATKELGEGQSKISGKISGEGGEIAFNYHYLVDILSRLEGDKFKFEMTESLNPVRFSQVGKNETDFFHIIMPVRVQS